jgi:hypothetical protein
MKGQGYPEGQQYCLPAAGEVVQVGWEAGHSTAAAAAEGEEPLVAVRPADWQLDQREAGLFCQRSLGEEEEGQCHRLLFLVLVDPCWLRGLLQLAHHHHHPCHLSSSST